MQDHDAYTLSVLARLEREERREEETRRRNIQHRLGLSIVGIGIAITFYGGYLGSGFVGCVGLAILSIGTALAL